MTGHHLSRRGLLLGAVGAAAAGLLAACGDDGEGEPAGSGSGSAPAGGGSFPAGVTHQFGTTTVEAAPAAVVSLGWADADALLAMGVVPAGILDWFQAWPQGVGPWAQAKLNGATPQVLKGPEINFEAVAALRPDLITFVKSDNVKATWEQLEKLAPTLSGPAGTQPYGTTLARTPAATAGCSSWRRSASPTRRRSRPSSRPTSTPRCPRSGSACWTPT
jgi:iron complex transport system substrate-binding protein